MEDERPRRLSRPRIPGAIFYLIAVLATSLALTYAAMSAASYPPNYDQVRFLAPLYTAYARVAWVPDLATRIQTIEALVTFKGALLEAVGFLCMLVFGPARMSLLIANLLFFATGLWAVHFYLRRRFSGDAAWFGVGLVLLCRSLYEVGGIQDLRWDFAGLVMFGLAFMALLDLQRRPGGWSTILFLLLAIAAVGTRSITGVYIAVAMVALALWNLGGLIRGQQAARSRFVAMMSAGIVLASLLGILFALFFRSIADYYGKFLTTDEGAIRLTIFGLASRSDLAGFYLRSLADHFTRAATALVVGCGVFFLLGRCWRAPIRDGAAAPIGLAILLPCAGAVLIGVIGPLSVWSASPLVVGVLTIPLAVTGGALFGWIDWRRRAPGRGFSRMIAGVVLAAGIFTWFDSVWLTLGPRFFSYTVARAVDRTYTLMADDLDRTSPLSGSDASFLALTDFSDFTMYQVWLAEHGRMDLMARTHQHQNPNISVMPENFAPDNLRMADQVMIFRDFVSTGTTTLPSMAAMAEAQPRWQPILDRDFVLRSTITDPDQGGTVGYYARAVRITRVASPLEERSTDYPAFWASRTPTTLRLSNGATDSRTVDLTFLAAAGPSAADPMHPILTLRSDRGESRTIVPKPELAFRVAETLTVPPGDTVFTLIAESPLKPPPANPLLATRISEIRIRSIQPRGADSP